MNHEGAGHVHYSLDGMFNSCILMMGSNTRETPCLAFIFAIGSVFICNKDTIITVIVRYLGACLLPKPFFKVRLAQYCFVFTKGYLILNPDQARIVIIVDSAAMETIIAPLTAITIRQTSGCPYNKLIS